MEILGGFMVMMSILGFFLAVLWFILPFVIFAMKGKLDQAHELLTSIDQRLARLERELPTFEFSAVEGREQADEATPPDSPPCGSSPPSAAE